jgi:hypothetical protein
VLWLAYQRTMNFTAIASYVVARAQEASTYAAIAAFLAAMHVSVDPGLWQHVIDAGMTLSALAGVVIKEGT